MKFFTPSALVAAALLSVVAALPFLPSAKIRPDLFVLEAQMSSSVDGVLRAYFDDGKGLREELSGSVDVAAGPTPRAYRLPVPSGTYNAMRFDPLETAGTVRVSSLRIVTAGGRVVAALPLAEFKAEHQIHSLQHQSGALEIVTAPGSNDPQIALAFKPPLAVRATWMDHVRESSRFVLPLFGALAACLFALDRAPRFRLTLGRRLRQLADRPMRAVALVAAIAVLGSAYPVVFLGKSFVSPNLGTILLYDNFPTLPGYKSSATADVKLSDIGAVMWAHLPYSTIQHRALAQGELPLWNRYNSTGVPLLAQGQSMFGDPMHLLVIAANGAAWAWDIKYVVAKWLFAAGLGLTVLALTGARPDETRGGSGNAASPALIAALIVAGAAPFIGFFLYRVNHPAFFSLCYAPWPLYCLVRITQSVTRRSLALWAAGLILANLALMNSGTVKEAYMLLACVNFSGACVLLASPRPWRERLGKLGALAWAGLLFVLITMPIWATFMQTLKSAYTGYNVASAYQIQPTLLLGLFDEIFYRPLMGHDRVFSPSLNFLLLIGVLYFVATLRLHFANRDVIALAASSLLPLALAFGLVSPKWIVTLPFLSNIAHLDNTFSCVLIVLWAVLAGVGFATAAQRLGTREGRHDLIVAGLLLFALVFGWIAFGHAAHRPIMGPTFTVNAPGETLAINPFIGKYLAVLLIAAGTLAVAVHRAGVRRSFGMARGFVIAGCLAILLWRHGLHANTVGFEDFTSRPTQRVRLQARSESMELTRAAHAKEPGRGYGLHGNFFPGWTAVYGLETVHGPDALVNPWLRDLVGVSGVDRLWDWRLYTEAATVAKTRPFFDALNVRFYFDLMSDQGALGAALKLIKPADLDVYESPTAWPRAFFTDRIGEYDQPAELVEKIRAAAGRPLAAIQRADTRAASAFAALPRDLATRTAVPAASYRFTENSTSFVVQANGPGAIVLTEAYWPGDFRAEVNGRPAQIARVNHAFKGLFVATAGEYRVTIAYWPRHFTLYLTLCVMGFALLALSLGFALRPVRPG